MEGTSLALIDEQPLVLEALTHRFSRLPGYRVIDTGSTVQSLVEIVTHKRPDAVVMDISIAGEVFQTIARVAKAHLDTKIVVLTAAHGIGPAVQALEAGAAGYISKRSGFSELLAALEAVRRGETYITQTFASQVIGALRTASIRRLAAERVKLSIREDQIMRLLLRGKTNKEIAAALSISEATVKYYMTMLMQKLNVRNRTEAVVAARQLNPGEGHASDDGSTGRPVH